MRKLAEKILNNRIVDLFLISLILLNLVVFIFQTDLAFYHKYKLLINNFELFSVFIFSVEFLIRIITLRNGKDFFKPLMLIDLMAILPFYLSFASVNTVFLRGLRLFRLLRIAKLTRYTRAFNNIKSSFISKKNELIVTGCIFLAGLVISSTCIYFAEHSAGNPAFKSIPSSFWWSVVTFTSVGYGDVCPVTTLGKIVASFTAIMGVGIHGLLVGLIGAAFVEAIKNNANEVVDQPKERVFG